MVEACARANEQLKVLKLTPQEFEVVNHVRNLDVAESFVAQYVNEFQKTIAAKKGWRRVETVARLAAPVLGVFQKANFSPECSIALGLVGLLIIQPVNTRSDIEEQLQKEIGQLADILCQARFSQSMIPSTNIEREVDGMSATIIDFLIHTLRYQKKWGVVKILGAIISDFSRRFQSFVDKIKYHSAKIERLAQQGYTSVLMDSRELIGETASTTAQLQRWASAHEAHLNSQVAWLSKSVLQSQTSIAELRTYEALKYVNEINALLMPTRTELAEASIFDHDHLRNLAPKEQWHHFASEIPFPSWARTGRPPVLWIGGPANKRGACWVSALAIDIIEALKGERSVDLGYILCDIADDQAPLSPLDIFKACIAQLLKSRPEIVFQQRFMDLLPLQAFAQASASTNCAFVMLSQLIEILGDQITGSAREIFLLIDRIDLCTAMTSKKEAVRFLQSIQKLNGLHPQLRIVATSSTPAPDLPSLDNAAQSFSEVWFDPNEPKVIESR